MKNPKWSSFIIIAGHIHCIVNIIFVDENRTSLDHTQLCMGDIGPYTCTMYGDLLHVGLYRNAHRKRTFVKLFVLVLLVCIGIEPGTLVVTNKAFNAFLKEEHETVSLTQFPNLNTRLSILMLRNSKCDRIKPFHTKC